MSHSHEQVTPIPHTVTVADHVRAHLASFSVRSIPVAARVVLAVLLNNADAEGKVYDLSVRDITDQAERYSKRTVQRALRALEGHFWISTIPKKVRRDWNEKNVYNLMPGGVAWTDPRSLGLSSAGWADHRVGKPLVLKPRRGDNRPARSESHDLSRCAAPVALALPPNVFGDGVAPRPADPEGREGGMVPILGDPPSNSTTEEPTHATGSAQREIPERAADDTHDDLDVIGPRAAHALPDPIPVLHHRIQETLIAADAGDIIGEGYEGRIARRFPHHTEEQILGKIRVAGQLRKIDIFNGGKSARVWLSGNVSAMRGAFFNKLCRKIAQPPAAHVEPPAKPIPGTRDANGYFVPEKSHGMQSGPQIEDLAGEDRARAQNPAQGSGSSTPALPRVDASPARAHLPGMSTEAAVARVRAALAASYHDVAPLAEHATEAVARTIVDRHTAGGANGGRLAVDDVCAVIAQYATFQAFKAKRNEMVPPPATLLRFLYAEIRNAQPGCAKTITAKLAETKFTPAKGQRQAFNKQPGESLAHLDRPNAPLDMVKVREALALAKQPLVFEQPKPPPMSEEDKQRIRSILKRGTP